MTLTNNNHDMNFYKQFIGNNFYNLNTFMNNNDLNNSQFFNRRNNFENNISALILSQIFLYHLIA